MKNPGHWWRKVEDWLINLLHCKIAQISLACIARISILGYSARRNNFSLFGCTNVGVCLQVYTRTSPLPLLQFYVMNHNILLIPSPILNLFLQKKIVSYVAINLQWFGGGEHCTGACESLFATESTPTLQIFLAWALDKLPPNTVKSWDPEKLSEPVM